MSEKFTASNGVIVNVEPEGGMYTSMQDGSFNGVEHAQALREFFLHERDQELGRWRWPENPEYVVYRASGSRAVVINELTGESRAINTLGTVKGLALPVNDLFERAATAWRNVSPKPWHDAKPGEVWLITDDRQKVFEMTCVDGDGGAEFFTHHRRHSTRYTGITAGRMIWPEAVES